MGEFGERKRKKWREGRREPNFRGNKLDLAAAASIGVSGDNSSENARESGRADANTNSDSSI